MSKRSRSIGKPKEAALAMSPLAAERARLLKLITRLPAHQLQRAVMDRLRTDDGLVASLGPVLIRAEPRIVKCAVCRKTYDASNNKAAVCKSKEHEWECQACDECGGDRSDCGDCSRCGTLLCQAGTATRPGTSKQFCYAGVHVEVLPRYIQADYDDDGSDDDETS